MNINEYINVRTLLWGLRKKIHNYSHFRPHLADKYRENELCNYHHRLNRLHSQFSRGYINGRVRYIVEYNTKSSALSEIQFSKLCKWVGCCYEIGFNKNIEFISGLMWGWVESPDCYQIFDDYICYERKPPNITSTNGVPYWIKTIYGDHPPFSMPDEGILSEGDPNYENWMI